MKELDQSFGSDSHSSSNTHHIFDNLFKQGPAYDPEKEAVEMKNNPQKSHSRPHCPFVDTSVYVSPEMLAHNTCGPFTDLWSLGIIIY